MEVLASLDEQLNRPKWVVPVRPGDELEKLLRMSIVMCKEGTASFVCVWTEDSKIISMLYCSGIQWIPPPVN